MPMPLSQEIREKIINHNKNGANNKEIVKWLQVSKSSVERILKLYREENTIEPKPHNKGRKPAFGSEKLKEITSKIREQPDITLEELIDHFELDISVSALSRKLTKLNLTFKKRHCFQKSNSALTCNGFEASGWDIFHI
jgi:putative transposase